ncbi:hypothetical protein ILUMI_12632, partial [Ignelater luminosus]
KYKVRSGTNDSGKLYEIKTAVLLSLRCCLEDMEHFWIASNVNECGAFDDIILFKKEWHKEGITYLLQLKHQDTAKDIVKNQILATSGDFSLSKYLDSCLKLSETISDQTTKKSDIINHLRDNPQMAYILFTNKNVAGEFEFLSVIRSSSDLINLNGNIYGFNPDKLHDLNDSKKKFIRNMFLYTKQPHIKEIDTEIKKVFKKLTGSLNKSDKDLDEIVRRFLFYVEEWSKGLLNGNYPLTKELVLRKVAEILLEPFIVKLNGHIPTPKKAEEEIKYRMWDEMIKDKNLVVINKSDKIVVDFMERFICKSVVQHGGSLQNSTTVKKDLMRIPGKQLDSFSEYYECLWKTKKLPLMIEVSSKIELEEVTEILKTTQGTFQIIILNKSEISFKCLESTETFLTLSDLTREQQKEVLSLPIKLQGRDFPSSDKLNLETKEILKLTARDIIYILCNTFNIDHEFEELPQIFVDISLKRVWLKPEILKNVIRDTFLIRCASIKKFRIFIESTILNGDDLQITEWSNNTVNFNFAHRRIILCENMVDSKTIQHLTSESQNRPIHLLNFHEDYKLEWVKSWGTINNLKDFRITEKFEKKPLTANEAILNFCADKKPVIISSNPGMGKSVFINYFARNAPTAFWVLKINLTKLKVVDENFININLETSFEKILEEECKENLSLAKAVFAKFKKSRNIAVLLDGFDEILIRCQKQAKEFIKFISKSGYFVLVTTRPVYKNDLELLLDTLSQDLNLFTRKNQQYYLEHYFLRFQEIPYETETRSAFVQSLLNAASNNLNDRDNEFTGVPLQTLLLAEVFLEDFIKFTKTRNFITERFDLLYLYRSFIEKKVRIACEKFGQISEDIMLQYEMCKSFYALRLVFSEYDLSELQIDLKLKYGKLLFPHMLELLQKDGIVVAETETSVTFIHHTFAEFIAGEWLAENFKNENKQIIIRLLEATFNPKLRVVRNIFDRILAKDCPLHLAIINCQMDKIASLIVSKHFDDIDEGNRDCFHLLTSWGLQCVGRKHDCSETGRMTEIDEMARVLDTIPNEKLRNRRDHIFGYTPIDYAICSTSFHIANMLCLKMKNPRIWINLDQGNLSILYKYCNRMFYFSLKRIMILHKSIDWELLCIDEDQNSLDCVLNLETKDINTRTKFGCTPLHIAVRTEKKELVEKLIHNDADTNATDISGKTPLHWSVIQGSLDILKLLIAKGTDLNIVDNHKRTALHYAIIVRPRQQIEIVSELLSKAISDIRDENGNTPFIWAAYLGYDECVKLFLEKDIDIKQISEALHWAIFSKHINTVDSLLLKAADMGVSIDGYPILKESAIYGPTDVVCYPLDRGINIGLNTYYYGEPALCSVVDAGYKDILEVLLSHGLDIESKNEKGRSCLHLAAINGREDMVELLLSRGANVNARDKDDHSVLDCAVQEGHKQIVTLLLSKGCEISTAPLQLAGMFGHTDLIELFLSLDMHVDVKDTKMGWTALHYAAAYNQGEAAALLLSKGANIEAKGYMEDTPLICALGGGYQKIVDMLLAKGADIETKAFDNQTPLMLSVIFRSKDMVELLLSRGANVNARDKDDYSILDCAVKQGHKQIVTLLLSKECEISTVSLQLAAQYGHIDLIELFLSLDVYIDVKDTKEGWTALHYAAAYNHGEAAALLLSKGANIDAKSYREDTPLIWAVRKGHQEIVTILLAQGADIETKTLGDETPLMLSAFYGREDMVELFLSAGANANAKDINGYTVLDCAVYLGHKQIVRLLLSQGCEISTVPLQLAAEYGHIDLIELLLSLDVHIDVKDTKKGWTALHYAAMHNRGEAVALLLSKGANIEAKDYMEETPLIWAVRAGHQVIAAILLAEGADIETKTLRDQTPLIISVRCGREDMVELLLSAGANINAKDKDDYSALDCAVYLGHKQIVTLLLSKGCEISTVPLQLAAMSSNLDLIGLFLSLHVDIDVKDTKKGWTALHYAAVYDRGEAATLLLSKGANIEAKDYMEETPLIWAVREGNQKIVDILLAKSVDIETKTLEDETPLILSAKYGQNEITKLLMSNGSNFQVKDNKGKTAFHWAVGNLDNTLETIELFVSKSPNILESRTAKQETPLILATQEGCQAIVQLLLSKNASIKAKDQNGMTALDWSLFKGYDDIACLLLQNSADLEEDSNQEKTA